ncbi:hypothetical protein NE237_021702 [Protea cynaroides]|uniref:ACT domain-containing protein ACR n=1 Tax=Protea cynaroides TaxID=273540 RepID=A0A9Q0H8G0_9MAGN|nr:hypothetical protein NE237_021702 [Protea cynaroides]
MTPVVCEAYKWEPSELEAGGAAMSNLKGIILKTTHISFDGSWFMDVFHVTDQLGHKLENQSLIHHIQQVLDAKRRGGESIGVETCLGRIVSARPVSSGEYTAIKITTMGRSGLLSEISAILACFSCHVVSAVAWTHSCSTACILYVDDELEGGRAISNDYCNKNT